MDFKQKIICQLCNEEFKNNLGGDFTIHLKDKHEKTLEYYICLTEYDGIPPKCQCGACDLPAYFFRGKYQKRAFGHFKSDRIKQIRIQETGIPKCLNCQNPVNFYRKSFRKFCSRVCATKFMGKTPEHVEKLVKNLSMASNRLSKLHARVRHELNLKELGFVSEKRIGRFIVDEVNEEKKIILEINGDYIHANPRKYGPDDIIKAKGRKSTAAEKWEYDKQRKEFLESFGYKVITIWESDNLNEIKIF